MSYSRAAILVIAICMQIGCAARRTGPYAPAPDALRNPLEAQRLTMRAVEVMESDPPKAQQLLRAALTADLFHGPAHNNLGVLLLNEGSLYEAAEEFEWARKLMPGHPDPRMNLALTLERAGLVGEAIHAYESALAVYADHIPTIQALARLQARSGRADERTTRLLEGIALRGETEQWRQWARDRLHRGND